MWAMFLAHPAADLLIFYLIFAAFVGSMPKLPADASYKAQWAYGFLQMLAGNLRFGMNFFKVPIPPVDNEEKK